jgi:tripartite-type tricarboxylate transporter receptor subunit TctC
MLNRLANIPRALRRLPHLLFPALVIASSAATAQDYPNRPIHIIVPYAAGGAIDSTARILAERFGPSLRQT